ncbi:MAG: ComEA family DNA-binding protein [Bdellovibrionales bacterium]
MQRVLQLLVIFFVFSSTVFAGVNINTASEAEFEALKGIGPAKAKAIVEYRNQHGHFKSIDDLEKVSGVGPGTISQIRDELTVGEIAAVPDTEKMVVKKEELSSK